MTQESIQDYLLSNEGTLRIAMEVSEAWPEARNRLINQFLKRLEQNLLAKLPGWMAEPHLQFFVDNYPNFSIWKPSWNDFYWLTLQCGEYGKKIEFGVLRNEDKIKSRPHSRDLLQAMQELQPSARARSWWEAIVTMRSPVVDWQRPEVLWRIHADPSFLEDVAEQFLTLGKAVEPIIDRLVSKA